MSSSPPIYYKINEVMYKKRIFTYLLVYSAYMMKRVSKTVSLPLATTSWGQLKIKIMVDIE